VKFLSLLAQDIRFQIRYGFYFLYLFLSALYCAGLRFVPAEYKTLAASVVILTDPALLGAFFIGGVWLLEKGEGVHAALAVSPLQARGYVLSKVTSLSLLSTLSGVLIAGFTLRNVRYALFVPQMLLGSVFFTLLGLALATWARSVNQFIFVVILPEAVFICPAFAVALGVGPPVLEWFPASVLWRAVSASLSGRAAPLAPPGLMCSLGLALAVLLVALKRVERQIFAKGGGGRGANL
jgi:fluoroquinolone transport system permease protein